MFGCTSKHCYNLEKGCWVLNLLVKRNKVWIYLNFKFRALLIVFNHKNCIAKIYLPVGIKTWYFISFNWVIIFQKVGMVWQYVTDNFNEKIWCWKNDVLARNLSSGKFVIFLCVATWLKIDIFQQTKSFFARHS